MTTKTRTTTNLIHLAQSRGSAATTNAGARRYMLANLPASVFAAARKPAYERDAYARERYLAEQRLAKAGRYCAQLGLVPLDRALEQLADAESAICRRAGLIPSWYPYATPSNKWAGGAVRLWVSFGEAPSCRADTIPTWDGKWRGNDLSVSLAITQRCVLALGAVNLIQSGLITLDAESVAPREYRAVWARQHGSLGLKPQSGWIIRGYHSVAKTLAKARAEARAARTKAAVAQRARRRALPAPNALQRIWVGISDSLAAGNCAVGTAAMAAKCRAALGGDIGGIRADVLLSLAGSDRQRVERAIAVAAGGREDGKC